MDCGVLCVRNFRIIRSSMIGFCLYVRNWVPVIYYISRERCLFLETTVIWYILYWSWYIFSKLQFSVRSEILFDIGLLVCCICVYRWEELLSILYVMFVTCLGDQIKRDLGMELDVVCEFIRRFVCIELWCFMLIPLFLFWR